MNPLSRNLSSPNLSCLLLAGLLAAGSCTPTAPPLAGSQAYAPDAEKTYTDALARWTDESRTYDVFKTVLILRGTLLSPAFQQAWGYEQARRKLLPPDERDALIDDALRQVSDKVVVLFAASSPNHPNMALTRVDSIWRVRLYDDRGDYANPSSIEAFHKQSRLVPSLLFPYITRWDDAYIATFPLTPEGGDRRFLGEENTQVIFQMGGEPGAGELHFAVGPAALETERAVPTPFPGRLEPVTPTPSATTTTLPAETAL